MLDQDTMTNPLVDVVAGLLGIRDYSDPRLAEAVRDARYACLVATAAECVAAGVPVVMVAPFTAERLDPKAWTGLAEQVAAAGGRAELVWLRIAPGELADRLRSRSAPRDAAKLVDVDAYVRGLDLGAPATDHLEVDASLAPEQQSAMIAAALV